MMRDLRQGNFVIPESELVGIGFHFVQNAIAVRYR